MARTRCSKFKPLFNNPWKTQDPFQTILNILQNCEPGNERAMVMSFYHYREGKEKEFTEIVDAYCKQVLDKNQKLSLLFTPNQIKILTNCGYQIFNTDYPNKKYIEILDSNDEIEKIKLLYMYQYCEDSFYNTINILRELLLLDSLPIKLACIYKIYSLEGFELISPSDYKCILGCISEIIEKLSKESYSDCSYSLSMLFYFLEKFIGVFNPDGSFQDKITEIFNSYLPLVIKILNHESIVYNPLERLMTTSFLNSLFEYRLTSNESFIQSHKDKYLSLIPIFIVNRNKKMTNILKEKFGEEMVEEKIIQFFYSIKDRKEKGLFKLEIEYYILYLNSLLLLSPNCKFIKDNACEIFSKILEIIQFHNNDPSIEYSFEILTEDLFEVEENFIVYMKAVFDLLGSSIESFYTKVPDFSDHFKKTFIKFNDYFKDPFNDLVNTNFIDSLGGFDVVYKLLKTPKTIILFNSFLKSVVKKQIPISNINVKKVITLFKSKKSPNDRFILLDVLSQIIKDSKEINELTLEFNKLYGQLDRGSKLSLFSFPNGFKCIVMAADSCFKIGGKNCIGFLTSTIEISYQMRDHKSCTYFLENYPKKCIPYQNSSNSYVPKTITSDLLDIYITESNGKALLFPNAFCTHFYVSPQEIIKSFQRNIKTKRADANFHGFVRSFLPVFSFSPDQFQSILPTLVLIFKYLLKLKVDSVSHNIFQVFIGNIAKPCAYHYENILKLYFSIYTGSVKDNLLQFKKDIQSLPNHFHRNDIIQQFITDFPLKDKVDESFNLQEFCDENHFNLENYGISIYKITNNNEQLPRFSNLIFKEIIKNLFVGKNFCLPKIISSIPLVSWKFHSILSDILSSFTMIPGFNYLDMDSDYIPTVNLSNRYCLLKVLKSGSLDWLSTVLHFRCLDSISSIEHLSLRSKKIDSNAVYTFPSLKHLSLDIYSNATPQEYLYITQLIESTSMLQSLSLDYYEKAQNVTLLDLLETIIKRNPMLSNIKLNCVSLQEQILPLLYSTKDKIKWVLNSACKLSFGGNNVITNVTPEQKQYISLLEKFSTHSFLNNFPFSHLKSVRTMVVKYMDPIQPFIEFLATCENLTKLILDFYTFIYLPLDTLNFIAEYLKAIPNAKSLVIIFQEHETNIEKLQYIVSLVDKIDKIKYLKIKNHTNLLQLDNFKLHGIIKNNAIFYK